MIITQLIYINPGQETVFDEFESLMIPIITRHQGRFLLRVRPAKDAYLISGIPQPYEIHVVEFNIEDDFNAFMHDEERTTFLHLKEQSIQSATLIKGTRL